jgi:hypothetical protein
MLPARQTDGDRRLFWEGFAVRYPRPLLRWGNTFARWRDVPGTELIVSYNVSTRGVGVFVRGQRGVPVRETAAQLAGFSLELVLHCPLGNAAFPFVSWLATDIFDPENWPHCHDWLFVAGDRYAIALAEVMGGLGA